MTTTPKCFNCGSVNFYFNEDHDVECRACNRIQVPAKSTKSITSVPKPKPTPQRVSRTTARKRATENYRNSDLWRRTRQKHDRRWRNSPHGQQIIKEHQARMRLLRRIAKRLQMEKPK